MLTVHRKRSVGSNQCYVICSGIAAQAMSTTMLNEALSLRLKTRFRLCGPWSRDFSLSGFHLWREDADNL
jgi:hypothetical protein